MGRARPEQRALPCDRGGVQDPLRQRRYHRTRRASHLGRVSPRWELNCTVSIARKRLTWRSHPRCAGSYQSIPQKNVRMQQLAIDSLAVYASCCRYFIIVAPPAAHADSKKACDPDTYLKRGWQLSRSEFTPLRQVSARAVGSLHQGQAGNVLVWARPHSGGRRQRGDGLVGPTVSPRL
eukprot:2572968-Prymnesium_polylepis.2